MAVEKRVITNLESQVKRDCVHKLTKIDHLKSKDLKQKAHVKWSFAGDENSKYFHSLIMKNVSSNHINGCLLMVCGIRIRGALDRKQLITLKVESGKNTIICLNFSLTDLKSFPCCKVAC